MTAFARILTSIITKVTSFRVIVAVVTSSAVTASVAGPLAYQAVEARNAEPPPTTIVTTVTAPEVRSTTSAGPIAETPTTTTSTTTTTTTTTATPISTAAPTTTLAPATTRRARVTGVYVSAGDSTDGAALLDGSRVTGQVYVYGQLDGAAAVSWFLDDPTGASAPLSADAAPGLQLYPGSPAPPFDTTKLSIGLHTLLARLTLSNGTVTDRVATFEVAAGK